MITGIHNFIRHLRSEGYHPRSDKHSNSLSCSVVGDLLSRCSVIRSQAAAGDLVFSFNFDLLQGTSGWNVDLVLGTPSPTDRQAVTEGEMRRAPTSTVRIAVEHKAVITEHRKAVKNRKRDFEAHHEHVHRYSASAIAAGILIVNGASTFKSPLRQDVTQHRDPKALVEHCIDQMRAVSQRPGSTGHGLEAKAVIAVDLDNVNRERTGLYTSPPAPQVGDPLHYDAFIERICTLYVERFST